MTKADRSIRDLPDYPVLKRLAAALWQKNDSYHGAAIVIGAGFSRVAAHCGDMSKRLPLWADLSKALAEKLGANIHTDPLRLAEEYTAAFGRSSIHELIENSVCDESWQPGELHSSLLELPWSEVLTTNWDTLLERASKTINHPVYSIVSKQEDLASARSPRITKLHGTIGISTELVFTQEDYRKYPTNFSAFVNFSRQVFIENELCLLGFSGDDPNFLQWAGWVRDQLQSSARRVYIIGPLNLTASRRRYLESINISPIDLWDAVLTHDNDAKHLKATQEFINELYALKPEAAWEWSPKTLARGIITTEEMDRTSKDASYAASLLKEQIKTLAIERNSYPGWLVCPNNIRWNIYNQISDPYPTKANLMELCNNDRALLLYEIAWRHGLTYEITYPWLMKAMLEAANLHSENVLTKKQRMEMLLHLLWCSRWLDEEDQAIENKFQIVCDLEAHSPHWPEISNEIALYNAVVARDTFNHPEIKNQIDKISSNKPGILLRKAGLLAEIGRLKEGEKLVTKAYRDLLSQFRGNRNSIYVLSRLSWAHWLFRGIQSLSSNNTTDNTSDLFRSRKCNPLDEIDEVRERVDKKLEKQQKRKGIEPDFEPGAYRDNSKSITLSSDIHPLLVLDGISNATGIPVTWSNFNFFSDTANRLAQCDDLSPRERISIAIRASRSEDSDALKTLFSRVYMGKLPADEANTLLDQCFNAVKYWVKCFEDDEIDNDLIICRLRIFMEILARTSVRASPDQAKSIFLFSVSLGKNFHFRHWWLFGPLGHLIKYSLQSIPTARQCEIVAEALLFPLEIETGIVNPRDWPNIHLNTPGEREDNTVIDRRIDEIIRHIAPGKPECTQALDRLIPLVRNGYLRDDEIKKIEKAVWGDISKISTLPKTGLLAFSFLILPTPNKERTAELVRQHLFSSDAPLKMDGLHLHNIINSAYLKDQSLFPDQSQAKILFDQLTKWRPEKHSGDELSLIFRDQTNIGKQAGAALSESIVRSLDINELSEENFKSLYSFYSEVKCPESIPAFVYFFSCSEQSEKIIEMIIREALRSREQNSSPWAAKAILRWRELSDSEIVTGLVSRLVFFAESCQLFGLASILETIQELYARKYLSEEDIRSLTTSLPAIFNSTDYKSCLMSTIEEVSISLVRASCVKVMRHIVGDAKAPDTALEATLEKAKIDPLPEVRFAAAIKDK